ncbi:hypothetical protein J5N97_018114 [Dioscorea zingiberensis]|uniref:Fe2OG dioxygenase domain-containing protein n=1 Tax=Dioscorea zingiberensis TaxID=325984 RepID=A0A9D5CNQ4_9LILI|nr:hypothetical protein J5N97_018114 [Dioscorea zingiberensis]
METHGLLLIHYDIEPSDQALLHKTFSSMQQLFNLPHETKLKNSTPKPYYTYLNTATYETLAVINSSPPEELRAFTRLMWPNGNDDKFYETMNLMSKKMRELSMIILNMLRNSYGIGLDVKEENIDPLFRMMKYSAPMSDEPVHGVAPHTDRNFITLLCQNEVDGLLFKPRDDGEWVKVNPDPGSFIVFAGDALRVWSNGRVHSPPHMVMMCGDKERLSCGLFLCPKGDQVVEPCHDLVDDEHPPLFKPFIFLDYLHYASENAFRVDTVLDSFAGI